MLTSTLLAASGVRHAFFTRSGGVSSGGFASLNASFAVGDEPANVRENRRRALRAIGPQLGEAFLARQVHGRNVIEVTGQAMASDVARCQADALVSARPNVVLGVLTADCVPLLMVAPDAGAVAAVHAGWRGVESKVVEAAVLNLCKLGARPERLLVALGPHVGANAFEVGEDVAARLAACSPAADVVVRPLGLRPRVDLARILIAQLEAAGVPPAHVDRVSGCTYAEPERFFSYRRDGKASGRLLSVVVAPEPGETS